MVSLGRDRRAGSQVRRVGVVVAIVLAVAFVVAQTSPLVRETVKPLRAGMDDIVVQSASAFQGKAKWSFNQDAKLKAENDALKLENRQLEIWRDTAISMSERMRRYEELLNLVGEPVPQGVSARVVTETDGPFAETRLANAGHRNGVRVGAIAVNKYGVVGRVIRVGNRSSRILLVSDFNSRVPVMGEISGIRAMLAGGRDRNFGQLIDKPEKDEFILGENLITTGEGNAFPRGLRVGLAAKPGDVWVARLALADGPIDFVRLLPPAPVPKPEDDELSPADPQTEGGDSP